MLDFARRCKAYVPDVVMTVVDQVENPEEIAACRALCEARGLRLRGTAHTSMSRPRQFLEPVFIFLHAALSSGLRLTLAS